MLSSVSGHHVSLCFVFQAKANFSYILLENLKPIAAQEREVEAQKAKDKAELEAVRKAEAAKSELIINN